MRRRILLLVVGMTTLVVLAFAIPLAVLIHNNEYNDGVDGLRKETNLIVLYLRAENETRTPAQIAAYLARLDDNRAASVELPGGSVIGRQPPGGVTRAPAVSRFGFGFGDSNGRPTSSASATRTAGNAPSGGLNEPGFGGPGRNGDTPATSYLGGRIAQVAVPVFRAGGTSTTTNESGELYTVRVYAADSVLRSGQTGPLLLLGAVAIALLLVGAAAGEFLTRRIVQPLVETAATAGRLSHGDVNARAPTHGPTEVADVGRALNRLADRIDELIAEERETVADMSHRLRTPLTALRLDAEALRDPADAERVGTHVSTLERMLTAVIHAARRPQREGRMPSCDANAVVGERVRFWSALTEEQGRTGSVALLDEPLLVRAGNEDLAAAVDALLENVVAHTPEGVAFAVRLAAAEPGGRLTISDDGPGLPAETPVRGRSDRGSTGLGLDIARRCAEASGGSMTLGASPSGGACVTLQLGGP